jgi:hypothetical protein
VVGYGATRATWDRLHVADPRLDPGAGYDPTPGLGASERGDDRYFEVTGDPVIQYSERLPHGTSIASAKRAALAELPSDGRIVWFTTRDTCAQMELQSSRLEAAMASDAPPLGQVFVEVATETSQGDSGYDPRNANELIFIIGIYPKASDAPGC